VKVDFKKSFTKDLKKIRDKDLLQEVKEATDIFRDKHGLLELSYMLDVAEAILQSALQRTESRGSYQRTDHPTDAVRSATILRTQSEIFGA